MSFDCGKCGRSSRNELIEIKCNGFCSKVYHKKCVNLTDYDVGLINKNSCIKFMCDDCSEKCSVLIKNYGEIIKKVEEDKLKIIQNINELKLEIIKEIKNQSKVKKNSTLPTSYADQLKLPIIIKPKNNKKQESAVTKQDIKNKINPSSLAIEINRIKELKNDGAVSISCGNKHSVEKIESAIIDKMGNDYEVQVPQVVNPKILVVGMHEQLSADAIIGAIKSQNRSVPFNEIKCLKVYKSLRNNNVYNAIVELDGNSFNQIMEVGKINIEWDRCKIYEYLNILRCYKCAGFNHKAVNCKTGNCCYKCGEKDHLAQTCIVTDVKCINCVRAKNTLGLTDLNVEHETRSLDCPIYKRQIHNLRNKTIY